MPVSNENIVYTPQSGDLLSRSVPVCIKDYNQNNGANNNSQSGEVRIVASYLIDGKYYPVDQFIATEPDSCSSYHFHTSTGEAVSIDDLSHLSDPNPNGCGFGLTSMFVQYPLIYENELLAWQEHTGITISE